MSITEASRFQLRTAIGQILSEEAADTLMELLPPVGWADVATKTDLQYLRDELKSDMLNLQLTIEVNVRKLIHEQTKWLITTMIAMNAVTVAVAASASVPIVHVTTPLDSLHEPCEATAETNEAVPGSVSVTTTLFAALGPLLSTAMV